MDSFPAPAFSKKTFGETRADTVESVFLHRPGGSGVSDPSYRRTVAHAPLPSGHRYETTTQVSSLPDEGLALILRNP